MTNETLILCTKCGNNPKMKWETVCAECKNKASRERYADKKHDTGLDAELWAFLYVDWFPNA